MRFSEETEMRLSNFYTEISLVRKKCIEPKICMLIRSTNFVANYFSKFFVFPEIIANKHDFMGVS